MDLFLIASYIISVGL